jgi:hypothetical protein
MWVRKEHSGTLRSLVTDPGGSLPSPASKLEGAPQVPARVPDALPLQLRVGRWNPCHEVLSWKIFFKCSFEKTKVPDGRWAHILLISSSSTVNKIDL